MDFNTSTEDQHARRFLVNARRNEGYMAVRGNHNIVEASGTLYHRRGSDAIVIGAIYVFTYVSPVKHGERLADAVERTAQQNIHFTIRNSETGPRNSLSTTIALSSKISKDP